MRAATQSTFKRDYVFERVGANLMPEQVRMSELFGKHDTLILYSFMSGPERETPCLAARISSMGSMARPDISQRASLYIVPSHLLRGSPGRTCAGGITAIRLDPATLMTRTTFATHQSSRPSFVKSMACPITRTGTRRSTTCSVGRTARFAISGAAR